MFNTTPNNTTQNALDISWLDWSPWRDGERRVEGQTAYGSFLIIQNAGGTVLTFEGGYRVTDRAIGLDIKRCAADFLEALIG